ncbi:MAG: AAA family ATPase [Bacteroides thetaiotaomicron]
MSGFSGAGKSASLRNLRNQEKWMYLNCEAGKRLPFANKFQNFRIVDPYQIYDAFDYATNEDPSIEGIIVDSATFLMDMYETMYVLTAANTMQAWSNFAQYFKILMQQKVTAFGKPVIFTAHLLDTLDEKNMEVKTSVPIKGALKNNGIEAYFSTVVTAKKMTLKDLEKFGSQMLVIDEEDKELGFKHVFQTRITKGTTGERIRSPMGMFTRAETYIDNDCQVLLDHLHQYYQGA